MTLIDNQKQTMLEALKNALTTSDRVDIQVGYFYFSGFELLAHDLKDKQVRILVGKQIDPKTVPNILAMQQKTGKPVDLDRFQPQNLYSSRSEQKADYFDGFTRLFNETQAFDDPNSQEAYKIFEQKIINGSLQIKLTNSAQHGKIYLIHNKAEYNQGGDFPGTRFMGSSNFTYNGLLEQGELNDSTRDKQQFLDGLEKFESMWIDSDNIDIATADNQSEFKEVISKLWINSVESPYLMYIRVLHELFNQDKNTDVKTPSEITEEAFLDLEYQVDAIRMGINKIEQYGGVIVADVVGLGKSIIASAIAHNVATKDNSIVVVISPPHLKTQWEEYQATFRLPGTIVISSGKIEEAYKKCFEHKGPITFIIDEAHRYRNELTDDYTLLHQLVRSNQNNKVIVLTATPFNNDPKDVFALVKLFQTPGQSTIRSVDNLSIRFRELIDRYKKLRSGMRSDKLTPEEIIVETRDISKELKRLIEPIIIRRSRLDLKRISRYRNNLIKQGIEFPEIDGPTLLEYDLENLFDLYLSTLEKITDDREGFGGARYKPVTYILDEHKEAFRNKYSQQIEDSDLITAQTNLAQFMKRLLVMRFESSKDAFRITLQNMIDSNKYIAKWYAEHDKVPVLKKGRIPDPDSVELDTDDELSPEIVEQIDDKDDDRKKLIFIDKSWLSPSFIKDVENDTRLLEEIQNQWFGSHSLKDFDPKLDCLKQTINELLNENPQRKIIIFSAYADTVDYVATKLKIEGFTRIFKYTAKDASKTYREELKCNFDAGVKPEFQKDDYDILVATDALSEGYNLHRAGVIFNYDIPFNPTRVIQRIGRINRVNKKVFDRLHIFNFFPTAIGEEETRIKQISTLKINLINSVIGSDTKTLTDNEELRTFYEDNDVEKLLKKQLDDATSQSEEESWDAIHREKYDQTPDEVIKRACEVRPRSRVIRKGHSEAVAIAFGKRGGNSVFAIKQDVDEPMIVSTEQVLPYFVADEDENGYPHDDDYDQLFVLIRDKLFEKSKLPKIGGNRAEAIQRLTILAENLPVAKDYALDLIKVIKEYDDLSDGQYKDIAKTNLSNLDEAYNQIKMIAPVQVIKVTLNRADQLQNQSEMIVLSEELRV